MANPGDPLPTSRFTSVYAYLVFRRRDEFTHDWLAAARPHASLSIYALFYVNRSDVGYQRMHLAADERAT